MRPKEKYILHLFTGIFCRILPCSMPNETAHDITIIIFKEIFFVRIMRAWVLLGQGLGNSQSQETIFTIYPLSCHNTDKNIIFQPNRPGKFLPVTDYRLFPCGWFRFLRWSPTALCKNKTFLDIPETLEQARNMSSTYSDPKFLPSYDLLL